ncbi:MAG: TssN family type VI secretion system protein [Bacteroidota bacterium]
MDLITWLSILSLIGGIACLIAFAFHYRKMARSERKRSFRHGLLMILAMWVWGILTMMDGEPYSLYIMTSVLMLLTGVVHAILLYLVHKWPKEETWIKESLFTGMIFFLGAFGFILIFYLKPYIAPKLGLNKIPYVNLPKTVAQSYRMLLNPGLIFFPIPFLMMKAWHLWLQIPAREFRGWGYQSHNKKGAYDADRLSEWSWVYFEFSPSLKAMPRTVRRRSRFGEEYLLGEFFYEVLQETNDNPNIEDVKDLATNQEGKPLSWLFFRKPKHWWEWRRPLSFRQTFRQNNIQEGDTVIAQRVIGMPAEHKKEMFVEDSSSSIKIRKKPTQ